MANFSAVDNDLQGYLNIVQTLLNNIQSIERTPDKENLCKIQKGMFFVLIYAALEKTVTSLVSNCIQILNAKTTKLLEINPTLWSLVFDPECNAIHDSSDKKWFKRFELFSQIKNNPTKNINDDLFPSINGNIKIKQIDGIWKTFGIKNQITPNPRIVTRLSNIADNRMKVAHGRESATKVGEYYSYDDLVSIYNDIKEYLFYLINTFESYIDNEDYKIISHA